MSWRDKSRRCKWCNVEIPTSDECTYCREKLRLIRKLKEVGEELIKRLEEADRDGGKADVHKEGDG
jgi:hypothetical protein